MRFFIKCDICNKEFHCESMRLPKGVGLVDGLDMCETCRVEYFKRLKKMTKELQKERFNLEDKK